MIKKDMRIMIIAGGTGGHIFSGLAIARYLISHGVQIKWLGCINRIESKLIPKYGIDIEYIDISGIIGKKIKIQLTSLIKIIRSFNKSRRIIKLWRPDVVLGMGGYVSGPVGLAAWSVGIPLVIHEQNAIAGFTNRILKKISTRVLQAFPNVLSRAEIVGNPIRDEILSLPDPIQRLSYRTGPIRLLVIGGSQGAQVLNKIIPEAVIGLHDKLNVWHQIGSGGCLEKTRDIYLKYGINHKIVSFIDDIAQAYAWADLVVCRSGALTVSEITAVGIAAIFVPFVHLDYHQYWNAISLQRMGAAEIIKESEFTVERISKIFTCLNRDILLKMAKRSKMFYIADATQRIAQILMSVSSKN
ncbi:undecaprenyldiphospho-muramoylpentapeptide beta-N-acetylglucosaminyltransferase [Blochmannia endosymbiont of Colobopsis nipponica]|uniref:undecaprenyldiphospho-muramoylpentapeptide beta-N-acetylglucosaminyltransferase n=1 Tax=Blochmannia endosymbiont of Colobopsis nipponica TaxID=2681987 RepID=UPI00178225B6|nr:undecaprenyldiphospho-muramoylpentapeptide beta-N-acetylglucosaminyltransferase [Blochmannia endosymbiont of Colobopsis nipponica]QOI11266.1 undecaprenyldiphospho-muramoylpentapeptide beta-N-acetylglucosaminyltransferase [Blochmannia endosymbiont of Colobopsis nipponica]